MESVAGFVVLAVIAICLCYLLPAAIRSRQMVADARLNDRFSTGLRVLTRQAEPTQRPESPRVQLHAGGPRPSEAPMESPTKKPTDAGAPTPAALEARRLAAQRAKVAAASSRRAAAGRRRLGLLALLTVAAGALWALNVFMTMPIAVPIAVTTLLVVAAIAGRRASVRARVATARERQALMFPAREDRPGARSVQEFRNRETTAPPVRHAKRAPAGEAPAVSAEKAEGIIAEAQAPVRTPVSERTGSLRITVDPARAREASPMPEIPEGEGWTPIPVPVPTYSLKAAAPRRSVEPYEAPRWDAEPAESEREEVLAQVQDAVREQEGAPPASPEQVLAEDEVARVEGSTTSAPAVPSSAATASVSGETAASSSDPSDSEVSTNTGGMNLQAVLERRRAAG